jgi:Rrf2 family cysteine metabolism transcriptional repressor
MKISVKGEYALLALFDLATRESKTPVKIAQIAKRQKIPQKFLELILGSLKQGGFVESRRGAEGGYLLSRQPATITVGEVLRFVERTRSDRQRGKRKVEGPFSEMWRNVDEAVSSIVDRTSFAELARTWADKQNEYVPNWEI